MKKLTAGIFATLLAVVSTNAANASIASKGYVDQRVGGVSSTVSTLQGTVSGHTTSIGEIQDTMETYGDIVTHNSAEYATAAQGALADTAVQPGDITNVERTTNKTQTLSAESTDAQYPSAKAVWDTIQTETEGIASSGDLDALGTRVTTAEGEIDTLQTQMTGKANTADLAEYVTKTDADADYAVKSIETVANTASTNAQSALTNIGTLSELTTQAKTNAVAAINEVASEAAAAQTTATGAQNAVDAVESTIEGYGDIVTHNAAEFATTGALTSGLAGKLDTDGTAARATADASGNNIASTYATKSQITALDGTVKGSGAVVTDVSQTDGKVSVTKGNVKIPVGGESGTTYATIWVE